VNRTKRHILVSFTVVLLLAPLAALHAAEVTLELKQPGSISAAVYDSQGRMVRELKRAEAMPSGRHTLAWDGLDMDGKPVPAGKYECRSLQTQGLRSEYLMSVGTSVGDRWWPGNHEGPSVLAVADDSLIIGAMPEGSPLMTRVGFDGKVIWEREIFESARFPNDVAIAGGKVFFLQDNGKVIVLDFATGKPVGKPPMGKPLPALFPVRTFVFGKGKAEAGETPVPLAVFDPKPGAGWDKMESMKQSDGGVTCDALEPRVFEAAIPNGEYLLRFHYGDDAQATTLVEVHPNGIEPLPQFRLIPLKMPWHQLTPSPAGAKPEPKFLPQLYQLPRGVAVKDGRLRIKFIPESPQAKPTHVHWGLRKIEVIATADRVAADDSTLVLSSQGARKLMWLDPATGETLDTLELADVRDVALGPKHTVFALLKDSVVSVTREARQPVNRITGLIDPGVFDVDAKSGNVVIAECGKEQQVKCYGEDFKLVATHGRQGGRKYGRYEPRDFASLSGIACDGHGGFVVSERYDVPRRTARFDAKGNVLREWFGAMDFYAQTALDPADPTIGWIRQEDEYVIQIKIDYAKRDWRPIASYRWTEMLDPVGGPVKNPLKNEYFLTRMDYAPWFASRSPSHSRMRALRHDINGKSQLLLEFASQPILLVHDEAHDRLRPLAAMGLVSKECFDPVNVMPVEKLPAAWVGAIRKAGGDPADAKSRVKFAHYSWADENGDGLIDVDELHLGAAHPAASSAVVAHGGFCMRVDAELNAWIGSFHSDHSGMYQVYKPERITACGAPVWPLQGFAGPKTEHPGETASVVRANDGGCFVLLHGNGDGTKFSTVYDVATHGWAFPSVLMDGNTLMRLDGQGNRVWQSGYKAARFPHPRGQLHGAWHLGNEIKGCLPVFDWVEQPCEFWTTDGLYVGGLFDGRDANDGHDLSKPGSPPDRLYTWLGIKAKRIGVNSFDQHSPLAADDMHTGGETAELPDGSVVFLGQGSNNNPCYRITGWDGWVRQSGEVRIDRPAAAPAQQGTGLKGEYFTNTQLTGAPILTRIDERLWYGINKPWPKGTRVKDFSVRWSGFIEPRFTESYCLSIYARGEFKLWIDGQEVTWVEQDYPREREIRKGHSTPIPLRAGRRVPVQIEYLATLPQPSFHLNWESLTQPVEHVPTSALSSN
jgi:hypothetical protein